VRPVGFLIDSDGCTLTAEHFKYAGESIVPSIVNLFNKFIQSGKIRKVFKTGILTKVSPKVAYGVQHQMPFDCLM
jgi:hypothetical protein